MARKGRIKSSEGIYHTVLRGENKLFFNDNDYLEFINTLRRYFVDTDSKLYAYSLEKNKVHLVFFTPDNISDVMKPLCTSYARYINRAHKKNGKLFYDRYMSEPIEDMDTLEKAVVFVQERKTSSYTSKSEYLEKSDLCDVSKLGGKIKEPFTVYAFIDDYASLSDKDLKSYIQTIGTQNSKNSDEELLEFALKHSNLSNTRVKSVLGLTKSVKIEKVRKTEPKKEEPKKSNKQELSFWLL